VYRLDPAIADAVLDHRRQEQFQMAQYIARDVALAPPHVGDGGMNPVFASKLGTPEEYDNSGRLIRAATAPGALPRTPNRLAAFTAAPARRPVATVSVPMPAPAPQAKEGEAPPEQPKSIASLLGTMFGGAPARTQLAAPTESQMVALRGSNTDMAAKPKRAATMQTASVPSKPHEATSAEPTAVAKAMAKTAPAPSAQQARQDTPPSAPEMRTAYTTPPASSGALLSGAQPVVPAGSFESRWMALR